MTYEIQKNQHFTTPDGDYSVVAVNHDLRFVEFYSSANNEKKILRFGELQGLVKAELWQSQTTRKPGEPASLLQATESEKAALARRQHILLALAEVAG